MGMKVYLVEKEAELGGHVRTLKDVWPARQDGKAIIDEMVSDSKPKRTWRYSPQLLSPALKASSATIRHHLIPTGEQKIIAGGVIVAIGFTPFDPVIKPELGYGKDERIMTTVDFEAGKDTLNLPDNPRIAILHCIGSRDEQIGKPYCSRVCCINALRVGGRR